jgi:hypothetical protein
MARPERLEGRDGAIWTAYVGGATQEAIAAEHGISRQRVGQVLEEVRATIGDTARMDAALLAAERADALLAAVWPAAMEGDAKAVGAALRVLERQARALGTDAVEPLRVRFEQHLDEQGQLLADAVGAVLDALDLSHEQRVFALGVAQAKLLGEDPPAPVVAPTVEDSKPDVMAQYREWCQQQGIDPDEDQDDDEDGDDE